jgi:hypothetical protein
MNYNSILRNNQDLDSFSLNPLNIKMENYMNNENNYDEIDYNKIMSNGEDKTNWKVIFGHMESVEGSIKNLMAMIDNSVILTNIV